jgi:hypothetical protein
MKKWLLIGAATCLTAVFTALAAAASFTPTVYNNIPSPRPGNVPSVGFEATSASEFGGQVQLNGTVGRNPQVTVLMSSWGCQTGSWSAGNCATSSGSGFSVPITLNAYNVGPSDAVGSLIATKTQTFNIPYRPSADATHCTGGDAGKWYQASTSTCFNGYAWPITFDLTGVSLPDNVILTVAYNTSHYGYAPKGDHTACYTSSGGCGYDSLNVGTSGPAATAGSYPTPDGAYANSSWGGFYCDGGAGGTGTLRFDNAPGCWTGYQPAFKVTESRPLCIVPDLSGMSISAAKTAVKDAHCTVGNVTKVTTGHGPHLYLVTSQKPAAGRSLLYPGYVSFTAEG